jgi:predicted transcriptional regulator
LHGKSAKPATIINEVGMQNQRVRQCLRILEGEGLFDGFAK